MKARLRLEGLYDQETISHIDEKKIRELGFDFRPKSFNFLQHYKFLEILESRYSKDKNFWLHFENENADIIQKLIADSKGVLGAKGYTDENIFLEFSGINETTYFDEFKKPFAWNFTDMKDLEKVIQSKYLKHLILPFNEIEYLYNTNKFQEFVAQFHKKTFKTVHDNEIKLALKADWDSDIFPSLFEYIKFDFLSLSINNKVESSFRNVDYAKFHSNLEHYQRLEL